MDQTHSYSLSAFVDLRPITRFLSHTLFGLDVKARSVLKGCTLPALLEEKLSPLKDLSKIEFDIGVVVPTRCLMA